MSDRPHAHHPASAPDPAPAPAPARTARLAALRARIRLLEGGGGTAGVLPLGLDTVDSALPAGGLSLGCLHEIIAADGSSGPAGGPADGFTAAIAARLAARCGRPVLWLMRAGDLYPPGLGRYGLGPARLILAQAPRHADRLWALEEAARSGALAAVVGEAAAAGPTEARRLQLAAEAGGVTVILLDRDGNRNGDRDGDRNGNRDGDTTRTGRHSPGTAVTRWRVAAAPGLPDGPGVGGECWRLDLVRARGGRPGAWLVAWRDTAAGLVLVAPVGTGAGRDRNQDPNQGRDRDPNQNRDRGQAATGQEGAAPGRRIA